MTRKPYVREISRFWWLGQGRYTFYMMRELTCVFIGAYVVFVLVGLYRLSQGAAAFEAFLDMAQGPVAIGFHVLALVFTLVHMATWFELAPRAMPVRLGGKTVSATAVVLAHYAVWIGVSALVLFAVRV